MSVATGTAIAIGAGVSAAGAIGGSLIGANASESAASTEANAAEQATALQQQEFEQQQQNLAPFVQAGTKELPILSSGIQPGGQFNLQYPTFSSEFPNVPTTFTAPTAAQAENTPGYQFAVTQADQALQRAQAATGITGGGAAKAISQYNQGLADTNYQNTYGNALTAFNTNLGAAQSIYGQGFNVAAGQVAQNYNEAAGLTGIGASATQQLNNAAQTYANNAGNYLTQGASATAAGTVGAANAYSDALSGIGNSANNAALYSALAGSSYNLQNNPASPGSTFAQTFNGLSNNAGFGLYGNAASNPVNFAQNPALLGYGAIQTAPPPVDLGFD